MLRIEDVLGARVESNKHGTYCVVRKPLGKLIRVEDGKRGDGLIYAGKLGEFFYEHHEDLFLHLTGGLSFPDIRRVIQKYDERILFLDIESCGLSYRDLTFMISSMAFERGDDPRKAQVEILFARDPSEEGAMLHAIAQKLPDCGVVVTQNGHTFDLRRLGKRMVANGIYVDASKFTNGGSIQTFVDDGFVSLLGERHIDTLPLVKEAYSSRNPGTSLEHFGLKNIEDLVFGFSRKGDIPGKRIPGIYHGFIYRTKPLNSEGEPAETFEEVDHYEPVSDEESFPMIKKIVDHNVLDVLSLASLLTLLSKMRIKSRI